MEIVPKSTKLDGPKVVVAPPSNFDLVFGLSCLPRMGTNHDLSEAENAFRTRRVKKHTRPQTDSPPQRISRSLTPGAVQLASFVVEPRI